MATSGPAPTTNRRRRTTAIIIIVIVLIAAVAAAVFLLITPKSAHVTSVNSHILLSDAEAATSIVSETCVTSGGTGDWVEVENTGGANVTIQAISIVIGGTTYSSDASGFCWLAAGGAAYVDLVFQGGGNTPISAGSQYTGQIIANDGETVSYSGTFLASG